MVPPNTIALTARQRITFILLLFSAVGASLLVLTWDLRPYPLAAFVDDYRYVLSAIHIKAALWNVLRDDDLSPWLGPYDPTTRVQSRSRVV
jgi:hypothetical protein